MHAEGIINFKFKNMFTKQKKSTHPLDYHCMRMADYTFGTLFALEKYKRPKINGEMCCRLIRVLSLINRINIRNLSYIRNKWARFPYVKSCHHNFAAK